MIEKRKILLLTVLILTAFGASAQRREMTGQVYFLDTEKSPASFVTIYLPDYNHGCITDEEGAYVLSVPVSAPGGKLKVEYACIGYESVTLLTDGALPDTVYMKPLQIMLPAAYVTPGFDNPADYILDQVRRKAKANLKAYPQYCLSVEYNFSSHELSILKAILPPIITGALKVAADFSGIGPTIRYCMDKGDLAASVSLQRTVMERRYVDSFQKIEYLSQPVPKNVEKNLLSAFHVFDLYGILYSDNCPWGKNYNRKYPFKLAGTYEWNGHLVDVLRWASPHEHCYATVHVIEDVWGILKVEAGYGDHSARYEARDHGGGFYLPVSLVLTPSFFPVITPEKHEEYLKYARDSTHLDKATVKRIEKLFENNKDRVIHPYFVGSFSVGW
ncbi:MAG: carboxypeptidase-like regulatory domain-containing protein [Bacteroidales bacterium]|nr:carboxypeptidase-like regulatory domain-containing protein [Bacteroidales bacterium]